MSTDHPVGSVSAGVDPASSGMTLLVWSGREWLLAHGGCFNAVQYPQLAQVFTKPRPKIIWHRPIASWRARRAWDAGDRMVYGGTPSEPRLPDFRGRVVTS